MKLTTRCPYCEQFTDLDTTDSKETGYYRAFCPNCNIRFFIGVNDVGLIEIE